MYLRLLINHRGRENRDNFAVWTDHTEELVKSTWSLSDSEGSDIDIFSFELEDTDSTITVEAGAEIIFEGSQNPLTGVSFGKAPERLFGGLIAQPTLSQNGLGRVWSCNCQDWKFLLDRAVVTKEYTNKKDWWIIRDAFVEAYDDLEDTVLERGYLGNEINLDGYGLLDEDSPVADINQLDLGPGSAGARYKGNDVDRANFEGQTLRSIIDTIASRVGYEWTVDAFKNFWYYPVTSTEIQAPFNLSADAAQDGNPNYEPFYNGSYFQEVGQFNVLQIKGSRGFSREPTENYYIADGKQTSFDLSEFINNAEFVDLHPDIQLSRPIIAGFPYTLAPYSSPGNFAYVPEDKRKIVGAQLPLIQVLWGETASERASLGQTQAYIDTFTAIYSGSIPTSPPDSYYTFPVERVFSHDEEVRNAPRYIRDSHYVIVNLLTGEIEFFGLKPPAVSDSRTFYRQPKHAWKAWGRYATEVRFIKRDNSLIDRAGGRIFVRSISDPNVRSAEDATRVATVFFKKQGAQFRVRGNINRDGLKAGHRLHVIHPTLGLDHTDQFVVRNIKTRQLGDDDDVPDQEEPYLEYALTLGSSTGSYQEYSREVGRTPPSAAPAILPAKRTVLSQISTVQADVSADPLPAILEGGVLGDIVINPLAESAKVSAAIWNRGTSEFSIYARYRKTSSQNWVDVSPVEVVSTETKINLVELDSGSTYLVQVSTDPEFRSGITRQFSTLSSRPFNPPYFEEGDVITRSIRENNSVNALVGTPIKAADPTNQPVTYTVSGRDASKYSIVSTSGQLTAREKFNFEQQQQHLVYVTAKDSSNNAVVALVIVSVINVNEQGSINLSTINPRVGLNLKATLVDPDERVNRLTTQWRWEMAINQSGPYQTLRSQTGGVEDSLSVPASARGRYLRIRCTYRDAFGPNQNAQTIARNRVASASSSALPPEFVESYEFEVAENSPIGTVVGMVQANSPAGLTMRYTIEGTEAAAFSIDSTDREILVNGNLNYEAKAVYEFTLRATDTFNRSETTDVVVGIIDVDEPPAQMAAPTLTSRTRETLVIGYVEPVNIGPSISNYLIRVTHEQTRIRTEYNTAALAFTIPNLLRNTSYIIEVAAVNPEGTGEYSPGLSARTSA